MKLLSLTCNQCSAPLEVPRHLTTVRCDYCNSRLQVLREGRSAHTELAGPVQDQLVRDVASLKFSQKLEMMDHDWLQQKQRYMVRGKDGVMSIPSKVGSVFAGVFGVGFSLFWMLMAASAGAPGMAFFGLLIIAGAAFGSISAFTKADEFARAQRLYHQRRQDLLRELEEH